MLLGRIVEDTGIFDHPIFANFNFLAWCLSRTKNQGVLLSVYQDSISKTLLDAQCIAE